MAVPDLKVEMWLGGGWVDLVALGRVDLAAGLSITRGRANEYGQMGAGQCSFVLANDDGAFTPELPSSPYRDSLTLHRPVRVSVRVVGPVADNLPTWVGAVSAWGETATLPAACTDGDLVVVVAVDWSSTTPPTPPAGWRTLATDASLWGVTLACQPAAGSGLGTWVGSESLEVGVWRGVAVGAAAVTVSATDAAPTPGLSVGTGSWVGTAGLNGDMIPAAPAGTVSRAALGTTRWADSNGPVASWPGSATAGQGLAVSVELSGGWSTRFVGVVDDDPVDLEDSTGLTAKATITAVDRLALMGLKQLRCQRDEHIMALSPIIFWPLDDQSGATQANALVGGVRLLPTQVSSAGTLEFGAEGGPTTAEGAGGVLATRSSATAGLYLLGDGALGSLGVEWSVVSIHTPSASGYLWRLTQGSYILGLYWSSSTSKYSVRQYNGSAWSTLATSSAVTTGLHVEVVTVSATQVVLRSDATHTPGARAAATFTAPTVALGYLSDATSGFDDLPTALLAGFAIVPGVMAMAAADTLATNIKTPPSLTTDAFMQMLLGWCGMAASVSWLGDHPSLGYIPTGTQSPASLADTISAGANGRFAVMADGSVCWVDSSYAPALAEIEAEAVSPPLRWARDRSSYVTDVTTSLPSGGSYTYSSAASGLVRESKSITGVLGSDQACKDAAAFLVSGSSLSPRLAQATFDLLTQPDTAVIDAVMALDIGSQIALTNLPPQIPSSVSLVVEGLVETLQGGTGAAWTITVNTSPSSQSLPPEGWYFAWVDGPTTYIDDGLAFIANI